MFVKKSLFSATVSPYKIDTGWGNGYVLLPVDNKYHGKDYDEINNDIDVHGGLTYSRLVTQAHIDHWDELKQEDLGMWIIGFDTGHYQDDSARWPKEEVIRETERLFDQLSTTKTLNQLIEELNKNNTMKERIEADIKAAMLSRNTVAKEILKFIKSEIQRKEGGLITMSDEDIQKLMRNQIESLKLTPSDTSNEEITILESYLPKMMTEEEIRNVIEGLMFRSDIQIKSLGDIMKYFAANHKGLADNKTVSQWANIILAKTV